MALIRAFEGHGNGQFEDKATRDPAGNWEIGWSHKLAGPTDEVWTREQADAQAIADLEGVAIDVCAALTDAVVELLTIGEYAALIDLTYNIGYGAFAASHLCQLVKNGALHLVPAEFMKWVHGRVNGKEVVLNGLIRRRTAEVDIWRT